jgi:hypothetical protein
MLCCDEAYANVGENEMHCFFASFLHVIAFAAILQRGLPATRDCPNPYGHGSELKEVKVLPRVVEFDRFCIVNRVLT